MTIRYAIGVFCQTNNKNIQSRYNPTKARKPQTTDPRRITNSLHRLYGNSSQTYVA